MTKKLFALSIITSLTLTSQIFCMQPPLTEAPSVHKTESNTENLKTNENEWQKRIQNIQNLADLGNIAKEIFALQSVDEKFGKYKSATLSNNGNFLLITYDSLEKNPDHCTARLIDLEKKVEVCLLENIHQFFFSHSGDLLLVTRNYSSTGELIDLTTGKGAKIEFGSERFIRCKFSKKDKFLFLLDASFGKLINTQTGAIIYSFYKTQDFKFSENENFLLIEYGNPVKKAIFDIENNKIIEHKEFMKLKKNFLLYHENGAFNISKLFTKAKYPQIKGSITSEQLEQKVNLDCIGSKFFTEENICGAKLSNNGKFILSIDFWKKIATMHNTKNKTAISLKGLGEISRGKFSKNSKYLAARLAGLDVGLINAKTCTIVGDRFENIFNNEFSNLSEFLLLESCEGPIKLVETNSGKVLHTFANLHSQNSITRKFKNNYKFSENDTFLSVPHNNGEPNEIFNIRSKKTLITSSKELSLANNFVLIIDESNTLRILRLFDAAKETIDLKNNLKKCLSFAKRKDRKYGFCDVEFKEKDEENKEISLDN